MKYYTFRILAAIFVMGSIGGGFLIGAQYGSFMGWMVFMIMAGVGIILHKTARRIDHSS
jgi:hypothetical protein